MRPKVSQENFLTAENFYKQAVALDPNFAMARARLAEMQLWLYEKFDTRPAQLAEARRTAEEAVRLDPDCGQAHMALAGCIKANYLTYGKQEAHDNPAAMRREVAAAVRLLPSDGYIALAVAMLQWDIGWNDEAIASFERAIVLNPREGKVFYNYGAFLAESKDIPDIPLSRWASDRALELSPDSIFFRLNRAAFEIEWTGEVARGKAILAGLPAGKDPDGRVTAAYCYIALFERDFSEALRLLAACKLERVPFLDGGFGVGSFVPKGFVEGLVHFWAGHLQEAYASLDSARWMLEIKAQENAGAAEGHYHVALAYAAMGWSDAAKAEIARSDKTPPAGAMATLFAQLGDRDSALPLLEQAVLEWRFMYLRLDPRWDSLRGDPRFEKIAASLVTEIGPLGCSRPARSRRCIALQRAERLRLPLFSLQCGAKFREGMGTTSAFPGYLERRPETPKQEKESKQRKIETYSSNQRQELLIPLLPRLPCGSVCLGTQYRVSPRPGAVLMALSRGNS